MSMSVRTSYRERVGHLPAVGSLTRHPSFGLLAVVVLGSVAMAFVSPAFSTPANAYVLSRTLAVALIVGLAQMVCLAVGQLNLSLGAIGGLIAITLGGFMEALGLPIGIAVLAAAGVGLAAGAINGAITNLSGINGLIVTLATGSAYTGINFGITRARAFYDIPKSFVRFGQTQFLGLSALAWVAFVVAIVLAVLFTRTTLGRRMLAVGGNPESARMSGVSPERMVFVAHTVAGGLAGIGGILTVAQLGTAQPGIGSGWLIMSFAAPIIGGAVLTGGHVSTFGTVLAALLVALIANGLILLQADPFWMEFLLGALILIAVVLGQGKDRAAMSGGYA